MPAPLLELDPVIPLSSVLRDLFGVTTKGGASSRSAKAPWLDRAGQVNRGCGLVHSLRAALDVSRAGNGALIFSTMRAEVLATLLLLAETSPLVTEGDPLATVDREHIEAAADRAASLSIWIDDVPLTLQELGAKIRRLAAEWETFTTEGDRLRRLGVVVVDGWREASAMEDRSAGRLEQVAAELEVSIAVVEDADHVE